MKRLLLATILLTTGATVCCALRTSTLYLRQESAEAREALRTQNELMAKAQIQLSQMQNRVSGLKQSLRHQQQTGSPQAFDPLIAAAESHRLSAKQRLQLLAELGFNWNTTGDDLIVSKETLRAVSMDGMDGMKLSKVAAEVLAVTPDERARIDAMTQSLGSDYQNWAKAHAQRTEPAGDVLARYSLPVDADFSQSLRNQFSNGIVSALGKERGDLLLRYCNSWMADLGMDGDQATTLTVKRYRAGDEMHLSLELKNSNGGDMSTDVSPWQPFPSAFLPLFPKGWRDLAAREGFALPKSFQKE